MVGNNTRHFDVIGVVNDCKVSRHRSVDFIELHVRSATCDLVIGRLGSVDAIMMFCMRQCRRISVDSEGNAGSALDFRYTVASARSTSPGSRYAIGVGISKYGSRHESAALGLSGQHGNESHEQLRRD